MNFFLLILAAALASATNKTSVCDTTIKPEHTDDLSVTEPIEKLDSDTLAEPKNFHIEEWEINGDVVKARVYVGKHGKKIKHGSYEVYSKSISPGKLIESGIYKQGKREGKWKQWNLSGKLISESEYRYNKFNGYITLYRENGVVAEKTKMKDGKFDCKDGISEGFYENGRKKFVYQVKDELVIKDEKYDSIGNPVRVSK